MNLKVEGISSLLELRDEAIQKDAWIATAQRASQ
jgi:hypothetical protein